MTMFLGIVATLAAGLFAGAAVYITLVEHPARVSCGLEVALREFRPSYRRAAVVQATLAVVGTVAALARFAGGGHAGWLVGGLVLVTVIPFTLVVIRPTNAQLLDASLDLKPVDAAALLTRWGRLHAVRSAASLAALIIFLALLPLG